MTQGNPRRRIQATSPPHPLEPRVVFGQGGVGWRDNTLHVVLMAGDVQAVSPFKPGAPIPAVVAGRPEYGLDVPIRYLRGDLSEFDSWYEKIPAYSSADQPSDEVPFPEYFEWYEWSIGPPPLPNLLTGASCTFEGGRGAWTHGTATTEKAAAGRYSLQITGPTSVTVAVPGTVGGVAVNADFVCAGHVWYRGRPGGANGIEMKLEVLDSQSNVLASVSDVQGASDVDRWGWLWEDVNIATGATHVRMTVAPWQSSGRLLIDEAYLRVGTWSDDVVPGWPLVAYDRHGYAGEYWVAPEWAATIPETLQALWDNDIYVVGIHDQHPAWEPVIGRAGSSQRPTYEKFLSWVPETEGGTWNSPTFYSAVPFLTGAITVDGRAMCYSLEDDAFATQLTQDIRDLNSRRQNLPRLDVAVLRDDTGSFGGSVTVNQAFVDVVNALVADGWDLQVAYSVFSEYNAMQLPLGFGWWEEAPYQLIFPLVRIVADEGQPVVPWNEFIPHETPMTVRQLQAMLNNVVTTGGGGDSCETNWDGLYQIATGEGVDANGNFSTLDSGEAAVGGVFPDDLGPEVEYIYERDLYAPTKSKGFGYSAPGSSGDIPGWGYGIRQRPRGATTVTGQKVHLRSRQLPYGARR